MADPPSKPDAPGQNQAKARAARDGLSFAILPAAELPRHLEELRLGPEEFESLMELVRSQIHLSLSKGLGA